MIIAEIQYDQHYSDVHAGLVEFLSSHFSKLESGLQGDSWIWIHEGDEKVAVDTFSSMQHQLKTNAPNGNLIRKVIDALATKYNLKVYEEPEWEAHEDE